MATKGVKFTDEHRRHISESAKKSKLHHRWEKGHKDLGTVEGRRKQAEKMRGNKNNLGKHWKVKDTSKMKGHKVTEKHYKFPKGYIPWIKGKHHTEEWRKKQSEKMRGENAPNWQGGKTEKYKIERERVEYKLWREKIFTRDKYTCQRCKRRRKKGDRVIINAHHIHNFAKYPELRFELNNGITLCKECHDKFHLIYGNINNNQQQIDEFIKTNETNEDTNL